MAFKCGKGFMSSAAKAQKGDGERKQEWHEAQSILIQRLQKQAGRSRMMARIIQHFMIFGLKG